MVRSLPSSSQSVVWPTAQKLASFCNKISHTGTKKKKRKKAENHGSFINTFTTVSHPHDLDETPHMCLSLPLGIDHEDLEAKCLNNIILEYLQSSPDDYSSEPDAVLMAIIVAGEAGIPDEPPKFPHFMELPTELRLQIYDSAFHNFHPTSFYIEPLVKGEMRISFGTPDTYDDNNDDSIAAFTTLCNLGNYTYLDLSCLEPPIIRASPYIRKEALGDWFKTTEFYFQFSAFSLDTASSLETVLRYFNRHYEQGARCAGLTFVTERWDRMPWRWAEIQEHLVCFVQVVAYYGVSQYLDVAARGSLGPLDTMQVLFSHILSLCDDLCSADSLPLLFDDDFLQRDIRHIFEDAGMFLPHRAADLEPREEWFDDVALLWNLPMEKRVRFDDPDDCWSYTIYTCPRFPGRFSPDRAPGFSELVRYGCLNRGRCDDPRCSESCMRKHNAIKEGYYLHQAWKDVLEMEQRYPFKQR